MTTTPTTAMAAPAAGSKATQGFSETALEKSAQTASGALAAQAKAMVEARFVMALKFPRSWDDVRVALKAAIERPGFAGTNDWRDKEANYGAAWYHKPVGDGVQGFSVRFAEEALRAMGNVQVRPVVVFDDATTRIITLEVLDLEKNISVDQTVVVEKTIERRKLPKGETALRVRVNANGDTLYILQATDEDILGKQQALLSKARRTCILQLLPGDIQAECRARILEIRQGDAAKDPAKVRRQLADGFAALGVRPAELEKYIGHPLASCSPAELADLRDVWTAIKEGKLTWAQVMEEPEDDADPKEPKAPAPPAAQTLDAVASVLAAAAPAVAAVVEAQAAQRPPNPNVAPVVVTPGNDPECPHPDVPEATLRAGGMSQDAIARCEHCGQEWALPPATVEAPKTSTRTRGGQGRLQE